MPDPHNIIEIGDKPYVKSAFPFETLFYATNHAESDLDPATERPMTLLGLARALRNPALSLVVCHPTFFAPWRFRSLSDAFFSRRMLHGEFSLHRKFAPQILRAPISAPIAAVDFEDLPVINRNNFFLLDRCHRFFKRELPADRWRVFLKTGHANLPTGRFRNNARNVNRIAKMRPLSLGLPMRSQALNTRPVDKTADIFFAGNVRASWVRETGIRELVALRNQGVTVDIPDGALPQDEFFRRCAAAWLTWSPEGYGWDCFRHYEALACRSVPVCNLPPLERRAPLRDGEHAIFYPVEHGGLSRAVIEALRDKQRLHAIAEAGRSFVASNHTADAIARYIVAETIGSTED